MNDRIAHDGVVSKIDGDKVTVLFVQQSACATCHARMLCTGSDSRQRSIVANSYGVEYQVGDKVLVEITQRLAWKAMWYAFGLPTLIALAVLFPISSLLGEMAACGAVLLVLALYYWVLYLLRDRLEHKVEFVLHRKNGI